ncbi:DUF4276 family protein [Glycomyces sp. NRRL B-16210]|uniref:DUF4276 family protein n=1 Tax=Glycomyces sp. NRRL B-16210 TaxID=1463821 RepID=UPI000689CA6C|nr:DUF4276 family protein [Glycomyces sp. NRRL B-16210]
MSYPVIASIVESHGEVKALPTLLHRLRLEYAPDQYVHFHEPFREGRDKLLKESGLRIALSKVLSKQPKPSAVLLLVDADDERCPPKMGARLRQMAAEIRGDVPFFAVIASREFESWFLAAADSLSGLCGLASDLEGPSNPDDTPQDAKGWLTDRMPKGKPYKETVHQKQLASAFDIDAAYEKSRSFRKFCTDFQKMTNLPSPTS